MARKAELSYETEQSIFAVRLRQAMEERNETQTSLAKKVGVQRQTISLYATGQSKPDTDNLTKIAKVLCISSDWLLGISEYKSKSNEVASATSLSIGNEAVSIIRQVVDSEDVDAIKGMNVFLSDPSFFYMARDMVELKRFVKEVIAAKENKTFEHNSRSHTSPHLNEENCYQLSPNEALRFLLRKLVDDFEGFVCQHSNYWSYLMDNQRKTQEKTIQDIEGD